MPQLTQVGGGRADADAFAHGFGTLSRPLLAAPGPGALDIQRNIDIRFRRAK
jgi:hypothetical protein